MDFIRILRSLEEFLYEVMAWILFYPRTVWSVVTRPLTMLNYAQTEMSDTAEEQYTDRLSPLLFLMLSLALCHGIELAAHVALPKDVPGGLKLVASSEKNLLIFRSLIFALFPLMFAADHLRRKGQELTRLTLRGPFFSQCYLAALFSLLVSTGSILARAKPWGLGLAGVMLILAASAWYLTIQALWLRQTLDVSWGRAVLMVLASFGKAVAILVAVVMGLALAG